MTAKQRQKASGKIPGGFVPILYDMLNSVAYKSLKPSAAKALPYFLAKYKGPYLDPQRYTSSFSFPYAEGKRYSFESGTFSSVIKELVQKGFIDPVEKGGLRGDGKSCNLFKLSRRWEKFGTEAFISSDWKCFQPRTGLEATPITETYNFKNGKGMDSNKENVSEIRAVGGISG